MSLSRDMMEDWFGARDVDEKKLMQVARLAELGLSAAATAHDLRQPLSALKMTLQILREKTSEASEAGLDLDEALRQLARVEMLVERTRSLFAPTQGMRRVDISRLLEELSAALKWSLGNTGTAILEVDVQKDLPFLMADTLLLEQLVVNLVNNARDAVEERGGGRVLLIARRTDDDSEIELIVADDGPGIPQERAARIFEPFFTTKPSDKGTGLGLYIVRRIAQDHGAELELMTPLALEDLERGRLSTGFRVAFRGAARADGGAAAVQSRSVPPATGAENRRALVVEDEPVIQRLIVKLLERERFECVPCSTGDEALAALDFDAFALIVCDKNLPGASGIEVLRKCRSRGTATRFILTTGYPSESSAVEAMELGADEYFLKPLDVDALRSRIRVIFRYWEDDRDAERRASLLPAVFADADPTKRWTVFVVEPELSVRHIIEATLRSAGCDVATHTGAADFEEALENTRPRLLVGRPDILKRAGRWLSRRDDRRLALAIADREGLEATIEGLRFGARGILAPPFTATRIDVAFNRLVTVVGRVSMSPRSGS